MLRKSSRRLGVRIACRRLHSLVVLKGPFTLPISVGLDRFVLALLCSLTVFVLDTGILAAVTGGRVQHLV